MKQEAYYEDQDKKGQSRQRVGAAPKRKGFSVRPVGKKYHGS